MTDLNQALIRLHGAVAEFAAAAVLAASFQRVLRRNSFLTLKTAPPFDPASGSPTPGQGRVRVEQALTRFEAACRGREASGTEVSSTIFGDVSVADFARFQELHVRHHLPQPGGN